MADYAGEKGKSMALIHLVRHAEPEAGWGEAHDPGLSARGAGQAEATAQTLRDAVGACRLVSSPLARCRETAAPLAALWRTPVRIARTVAEVRAPEGVDRQAWLAAAFAGTWAQAGLEQWRAAIAAFVRESPGDSVIFTHFVAINAAVSSALGEERVLAFRPAHASITTLEAGPAGLRLVRLGAEMQGPVL
jgi:broad specificity phosphatase PhoE